MSHSSELLNLKIVGGTPKFVANGSEGRMILAIDFESEAIL
jgi:hypothetical protein